MSIEENPLIRVAPYTQGASSEARVVIRRRDSPDYLCLSRVEFEAVEQLRYEPVQVSQWLSDHMAAKDGLNFRGSISLLLRLIESGFLLDTSTGIVQKLEDLHHGGVEKAAKKKYFWSQWIDFGDIALMDLKSISVHPVLHFLGEIFASWLGVILLLTMSILGLWRLRFVGSDQLLGYFPFATPEQWFLPFVGYLSLAACVQGLLQIIFVSGSNAEFIHGHLRLSAGCILNFRCVDDDVIMSERSWRITYQISSLLLPLVLALVCLQKYRYSEPMAMLGVAFCVLSMIQSCPLFRNPLVKLAEGETATLHLLESLQIYMKRGFFKQLFSAKEQSYNRENLLASHWVLILACLSLLWLYGVGVILFEILFEAVPHLWIHISSFSDHPVRGSISAFLLSVLAMATIFPVKTILLIPFQNFAEAISVPMRKARSGLHGFVDHSVRLTEVIENFLRDIPILAHLSEMELHALIPSLKMRGFRKGQLIIRQGDPGNEFYILAEGSAQIYLSQGMQPDRVLDMLQPGDSFGEIALIEHTSRTANVKATSSETKVLVLRREAFDALFPDGSSVRDGLTQSMHLIKIVLESQALSHLSPRQVREFVRSARLQAFAEGECIIREHDIGDCAYLIESGEVVVSKEDVEGEVTRLGRGDLIGATALVRNTTRTASVTALSTVQVMVIDKETFLRLCMANVFVALLVNDLVDRQLAALSEEVLSAS